ncbi:MAG: RNA-binding protein [Flavobacteriales bacterium]|nr:RNA-binding protein [Flavobacteriales bacterium]
MNIFVARLAHTVTDLHLELLFGHFGKVERAQVIYDKATGRSKQFGFVEMANETEAQVAIAKLDGAPLEGSRIIVKPARDRE